MLLTNKCLMVVFVLLIFRLSLCTAAAAPVGAFVPCSIPLMLPPKFHYAAVLPHYSIISGEFFLQNMTQRSEMCLFRWPIWLGALLGAACSPCKLTYTSCVCGDWTLPVLMRAIGRDVWPSSWDARCWRLSFHSSSTREPSIREWVAAHLKAWVLPAVAYLPWT